ncbi:MAG: glycosyltransferase family 2 protein [Lachnospiraceae bacterium]|jgi:GT2 family glycosyltransferase|nr:glycosyltransferase family 2 protein [Lachnospiraceae bacterium]
MKSTIVIPNYNGIEYLEKCILSIREDTKSHPTRILVIDNGSGDGSCELAEGYAGVEVIRMGENRGFCEAVNVGIRAAKTPYVILLNNDLTVERGFVEAMERALEREVRAFSAGAQMRMMKAPDRMDNAGDYYCALGWAYDYGKGKKVAEKYVKPRKVFAACGGAAIYRKEILDEIGLFDEKHFAYLEDVDIGYRARIYGYYNLYEPAALVYHAGSSVSGSKYNAFKTNLSSANSIYLIEKNMPPLQVLINLPFLLPGFCIKWLFFCQKGLGKNYLKGLMRGFRMYYKEGGRKNHVPFRIKNLGNYVVIQWELWINTVRRFLG